jgi:RES domain-containing protein
MSGKRRPPTLKERTSEGQPRLHRTTAREPPPVRILTGRFWHQSSPAHRLLDVADPAVTSGRYHRSGGRGAWYASSSETGAWAELFRHHETGGVSPFEIRRLVGRALVSELRVLDLTNAMVRDAFGVAESDLVDDDLSPCQQVSDRAHAIGYDGILAPSAALAGQQTLAVFASAMRKAAEEHSRVKQAPPRMRRFSSRVRLPQRGPT